MILGVLVILAAGVFTFFPVVLGVFDYDWYIALCWFWFLLGVVTTIAGTAWTAAHGWDENSKVEAREITVEDGSGEAPKQYIMIK